MKNKKTITFLINSLQVGGSEKVCITLCNELSNLDYHVNLIVINPNTPLEKMVHKKVNLYKLGYEKIYLSFFKVVRFCGTLNTKSLIVFDPELYVFAHISKILFRRKFNLIFRCYNTLSKSFNYYKSNRHNYINKPLIKFFLKISSRIVAQSTGMKKDLVQNFNVIEKNITIIPNPSLVLNNSKCKTKKEDIILFVGRIAPQKGLEFLIRIMESVLNRFPNYKLLILGEGDIDYENKIKKLVKNTGLVDKIIFEGIKHNTSEYYQKAKMTVLTSLFEGFPNVLVESISFGTPVVSFNCESGVSDIIIDGINGYLIPIFDIEQFIDSVEKLIKNPLDENRIIKTSEKFSIEKITKAYLEIL